MTIGDIENRIRALDRNAYAVFSQHGNEPKAKDVAAFETKVGFALPQQFRDFVVHPLGGLYVEVKEEIWPRPHEFDVRPAWGFQFGLRVYALSTDAPDWLSMQKAWADMQQQGHTAFVPFLKIESDPDPYCFTDKGQIVIWRHEMPDDPDSFDGGFFDALIRELDALEERKHRFLASKP